MFQRIFVLFAFGIVLLLSACSEQNPITPALTQSEPGTEVAALAKGGKNSFKATLVVNFPPGIVVDPGKEFVDDKGGFHLRGQIGDNFSITGDIQGTVKIVNNLDIDAAGNGRQWGKFVITGTFRGRTGAFSGKFSAKITAGIFGPTDFAARGSGGLKGSKIKGTAVEKPPDSGVFELTGRVLKDDDGDDDDDDDD